jgi:ribosomal biogenesis protein LAS1
MVNGITDSQQKGRVAVSVASLACAAGLPRLLVDLRHEATHNELPSLQVLRLAARQALAWLQASYWWATRPCSTGSPGLPHGAAVLRRGRRPPWQLRRCLLTGRRRGLRCRRGAQAAQLRSSSARAAGLLGALHQSCTAASSKALGRQAAAAAADSSGDEAGAADAGGPLACRGRWGARLLGPAPPLLVQVALQGRHACAPDRHAPPEP